MSLFYKIKNVSQGLLFLGCLSFGLLRAQAQTCPTPSDLASYVSNNTAMITWTENGTAPAWKVYYGFHGFTPVSGVLDSIVVDIGHPHLLLINLDWNASYDVYVRSLCDSADVSELSDSITFTIGDIPCDHPSNVTTQVTGNSVEVNWTANGNASIWEVAYGPVGFDISTTAPTDTLIVSNNPTATINDLDYETAYSLYVRGICAADNLSEWRGPADFTTGAPTGIKSPEFDNFQFFPNPSHNELSLKAAAPIESVTIYNVLGQKLISTQPNANTVKINLNELSPAVYFMQLRIKGETKAFRFIKE